MLMLASCGGSAADPIAAAASGSSTTSLAAVSGPVLFSESAVQVDGCIQPTDGVQFSPATGFRFDPGAQEGYMLDWVNYLRCLGGVGQLVRDARLDQSAQAHANYLVVNGVNEHNEVAGQAGFTGVTPGDRMSVALYPWHTWGEVLSRTGPVAREAFDGLAAAIYHRLLMLAPEYVNVGVGVRQRNGDNTASTVVNYGVTTRTVVNDTRLVVYPANQQPKVPVLFNSDFETPDPVPDKSVVGYPISVQSDRGTTLSATLFTLTRVSDGAPISAFVRGRGSLSGVQRDAQLGTNEMFLIPDAPLDHDTAYRVQFSGTINGKAISRDWTFSTEPQTPVAMATVTEMKVGEYTRIRLNGCTSRFDWTFTDGLEIRLYTAQWLEVRARSAGAKSLAINDQCGRIANLVLTVR